VFKKLRRSRASSSLRGCPGINAAFRDSTSILVAIAAVQPRLGARNPVSHPPLMVISSMQPPPEGCNPTNLFQSRYCDTVTQLLGYSLLIDFTVPMTAQPQPQAGAWWPSRCRHSHSSKSRDCLNAYLQRYNSGSLRLFRKKFNSSSAYLFREPREPRGQSYREESMI
jgi:hypothetical protein